MTFRTRLLIISAGAVIAAVAVVGWIVSEVTRRSFERLEEQRVRALLEQFRHEFNRQGEDVVRRISGIANADSTLNIAISLGRPEPDLAPFVREAEALARAQGLDFLELVAADGTIISSAQWPARFGYKEAWLTQTADWNSQGAFLRREQLPDKTALAVVCVRIVTAGDQRLYVAGGQELDPEFLRTLALPAGMRVLLYRNWGTGKPEQSITSPAGPLPDARPLSALISEVASTRRETSRTVTWTADAASAETFHAFPLTGRDGALLGALLVGSSRREQVELERYLRWVGILAGMAGVLVAALFSWWATARVTRPVKALAAGAREVAAGHWDTSVNVRSADEIGALADAFNQMTRQLAEQRDRLVQAERVAAWRELARRLAHELKNPLFPLQITVENLQRARQTHPEQFDEVFRESTGTLLAELDNLKRIIGRFSDFARMPPPELQQLDLNRLVLGTMKLFEAQLRQSPIDVEISLDPDLPEIHADPDQLCRALQNLVLNAIDAMPSGGTLAVRTSRQPGSVRLEVSDSGQGLTKEECERLFTPYYTSKHHGTGLGLAIVQSVVSDHGGRITVTSEPGAGATFRIDLRTEVPAALTSSGGVPDSKNWPLS